jgi:hypothetical protein
VRTWEKLITVGGVIGALGAGLVGAPATATASGGAGLPPGAMRAVSYYPSENAWTGMWSDWQPQRLERDFGRIAGLGANTVRLFVFPDEFGYPVVKPAMLQRLRAAVDMARGKGLMVELTLFDLAAPYADLAGSKLWASSILAPFVGDGSLAAVEVKNELDVADAAALPWARAMIPFVKRVLPDVAVTVSTHEGLGALAALKAGLKGVNPDFFSYHFYGGGDASTAYSTLASARAMVSPMPLVVGESGASTVGDVGSLKKRRVLEADQDHYFRTLGVATRALGLGAPGVWTLSDFAAGAIPSRLAVSAVPGEYGLGLLRLDGSEKPAATAVRGIFGRTADRTSFNNGFERGDSSAATGTMPLEWHAFGAGQGHFARDTRVAHGGRASGRLSRTTGTGSIVPAFEVSPVDFVPTAGVRYRLKAMVRGQRATGITRIAMAWFGVDGRYLGQAESAGLPRGTTRWTQLVVGAATPPGVAFVQIHLKSARNTGTVWFDDVGFAVA